jgi:putative transposase
MALDHAALLEVLDTLKAGDAGERIRVAAETMYQSLIDTELTATIGAQPWERSDTRTNQRNGSRPRTLSTNAGDLQLRIPKLRVGLFFPSLLDRRRRVDQALFAVVMEAYLHGVSTRKVDDLVRPSVSPPASARARSAGSALIWTTRWQRSGAARWPRRPTRTSSWTRPTARPELTTRSCPRPSWSPSACVRADGHRDVLGRCWGQRGRRVLDRVPALLKARGLAGVKLVIADAHLGLGQAVRAVFLGAGIQRCRVHFMRNVLAAVPKPNGEMVAALIRTIVAQPKAQAVREQLDTVPVMLGRQFPKAQAMLEGQGRAPRVHRVPTLALEEDLVHQPLERLNKEIRRRTDAVGVFPIPAALLRLSGAVLLEQHDEWLVSDRRYLSEASMAALNAIPTNSQALPSTALLTAS